MTSQNNSNDPASGLCRRLSRFVCSGAIIPKTDTERKRVIRKWLLLHMRPTAVPEKTLQFTLSWGLGGMSVVLILLQFGTGVLLKFAFEPTPVNAYASIQSIETTIVFGRLIRNLHFWSANLLVFIIFLHMLRVFFTGAFHAPRQFNWIIGWSIFAMVLLANFTGYLLPYDQLAFWAVTVSTGMLGYIPAIGKTLQAYFIGGADIGPATMRIFFALHTALAPIFILVLMGFHFWRIRKAGGLVIPRKPDETITEDIPRLPALPHLFVREITTGLVLISVVLALSVFFNAPLGDPANPGLSPNPTKAPWYFAGFQELLLHFHPVFSVFIAPLILTLLLLWLPYANYQEDTGGVWFASSKGRQMAVVAVVFSVGLTVIGILADEYFLKDLNLMPSMSPIIKMGLLPVLGITLIVSLFHFIMKRHFRPEKSETVQTLFVFICGIFIVLTLAGTFFRGKDMALAFPF